MDMATRRQRQLREQRQSGHRQRTDRLRKMNRLKKMHSPRLLRSSNSISGSGRLSHSLPRLSLTHRIRQPSRLPLHPHQRRQHGVPHLRRNRLRHRTPIPHPTKRRRLQQMKTPTSGSRGRRAGQWRRRPVRTTARHWSRYAMVGGCPCGCEFDSRLKVGSAPCACGTMFLHHTVLETPLRLQRQPALLHFPLCPGSARGLRPGARPGSCQQSW